MTLERLKETLDEYVASGAITEEEVLIEFNGEEYHPLRSVFLDEGSIVLSDRED